MMTLGSISTENEPELLVSLCAAPVRQVTESPVKKRT
jgi:hypothetical protein